MRLLICRLGQGHVGELGIGRVLCVCMGGISQGAVGGGDWDGVRQGAVCVCMGGIGVGLDRVLCVWGGGIGVGLGRVLCV